MTDFAKLFIEQLNADDSVHADHYAIIRSDGDARLLRYRGKDLPWSLPVRIEEVGWNKLKSIISSPENGMDFSLFLLEELYKLDEREFIAPELHLSSETGYWHLVETAWRRES